MKTFIALALIVACASATFLREEASDSEWDAFKLKHGKTYKRHEEPARRAIWEQNLKKINEHNERAANGLHKYTLKMNSFGDLSNKEFVSRMNGYRSQIKPIGELFEKPENFVRPASVDWRTKGYVTGVKDQGQCGSCWAFSTVASLEGQHFKKTNKLVSLSEQNLVDCSGAFGNQGCEGGLMDQGFQYIKANKGIDTEESYPYTAEDQKCKFKKETVGATVTGYKDIPSGNEDALTDAIASVGPISVAIDASHDSFQFYSDGIYDESDCSSTELDHGVTAVGYGSNEDGDYYIVKNSWNTSWGMQGYILMSRNKDNQCGIATTASYPTV